MEPYNLEKVNPKIRPNAYFPIKEGIKWRVENFRPYITIIIFAFKKLGLFLSLASLLLMFLDLPTFFKCIYIFTIPFLLQFYEVLSSLVLIVNS